MKLIEKIKKNIDESEIISFDIFDTLLLRPYVKPTDIFLHIEKLYKIKGFATARIKAETSARNLYNMKEDITLDEIYQNIASKYIPLKEKELELEYQTIQSNKEMQEIFKYAQSKDKRIIIISDMYLSKSTLIDLLKKNGYENFEKIYVSSEIKKTKATGNLYKYVCNDLNIMPKEILHIGDNYKSDILMAQKIGLQTYHYEKPLDQLLKSNERAYKFHHLYKKQLDASILLGCLAIYNIDRIKNYWQDFGFKYGGPVIFGYMSWLIKQLKKDNIKEVLFVARDGYSLQKVFNIIQNKEIKTHYIYAPRIINIVCNFLCDQNNKNFQEKNLNKLKTILSYFKSKNSFLKENTPEIKTFEEGNDFIKKHYELYKNLAQKEKENFQKYCASFDIKNNKIALIDSCSINLSAQKSISAGLPSKKIYGYYWTVSKKLNKEIQNYSLSSFQQNTQCKFSDWNIMELYMTAPNPPVEQIEQDKIIFKKANFWEQERIKIYPDLSKGIVLYTKLINKIFGQLDTFMEASTLVEWTNILCNSSTITDKKMFQNIKHACDEEHKQYIPVPLTWFEGKRHKIIKLWEIPCFYIYQDLSKTKIFLFKYIPIIKITKKDNIQLLKIIGIPFSIKKHKDKIFVKLFGLLPVLSAKENNSLFSGIMRKLI